MARLGQVDGARQRGARPSGAVSFLFTDVEGSTNEWASDPAAMAESLRHHDETVRREIEARGGFAHVGARHLARAGPSMSTASQCG